MATPAAQVRKMGADIVRLAVEELVDLRALFAKLDPTRLSLGGRNPPPPGVAGGLTGRLADS